MNKIIEDMTAKAMEQSDREWKANAPRLVVNGKEYVEEWYAYELFFRLKAILLVTSNFDPGLNPARILEYRKGLANIAKHGVPNPQDLPSPDRHE
ncbi:MAG: hypothetical protein LIO64_09070 [Akkermansia sp.]|nr:hypothetical protein [Akkermansia sp.]